MSRKCQWFAVGAGLLTRPPPVDCDARRARRLGAPPYRVSPCGASFFPSDGKETKGSPGETHIAVGNKFPPPPVRSPPDPRNLRGPNSRGLPVTVRRGRDNDCPRNRAAAAAAPKSRRPGQLDQTGAPDRSRSNLCGGESAGGSGTRPYEAISVTRNTMAAAGGPQRKAQRSGFALERRSDGMSELCPSGRSEGYGIRDAEGSGRGATMGGDAHRSPPPAAFWFLFRRGKRNSPKGRNPVRCRAELSHPTDVMVYGGRAATWGRPYFII